jgi:hypothetical protein
LGDIRGKLIYAMRITEKMPMYEYDAWTQDYLPNKVPRWFGADPRRRVGDAIYDFSTDPPEVRKSVHDIRDRDHDLGGGYALLSTHFFYFGRRAIALPERLQGLVHAGRGHRTDQNAMHLEPFAAWISGFRPNHLYGLPAGAHFQRNVEGDASTQASCVDYRLGLHGLIHRSDRLSTTISKEGHSLASPGAAHGRNLVGANTPHIVSGGTGLNGTLCS